MVSILCNPGVRSRHWEQMSTIVDYDLTPDSGTTLRKVLKQNLAPYLTQFEAISASASKVRKQFQNTPFAEHFKRLTLYLLSFFTFSVFFTLVFIPLSLLFFIFTGVFLGESHADHGGDVGRNLLPLPPLQRVWSLYPHSCG